MNLKSKNADKISLTDIENRISDIFKRILKEDIITLDDNFFELGGTSLQIMGLVIELNNDFDVELQMSEIIDDVNIKRISEIIFSKLR